MQVENKAIPKGESYTLSNLKPNSIYDIWLAAKSERGEGAATSAISVHTDQDGKFYLNIILIKVWKSSYIFHARIFGGIRA